MKKPHYYFTAGVKGFLLFIILSFSCYCSFCQKKVSGFLKDANTQPVMGVTIAIKNSNAGNTD